MMPLLDAQSDRLPTLAAELGVQEFGQLLTPRRGHTNWGGRFAIDNCAYSDFDPERFRAMLARERANVGRCIFAAVPDVVGSARRTLEVFHLWYPKMDGYPLALVAQDGIEDLEIPWRLIAAVFIGGSDAFKLGRDAEAVIRAAKVAEKWVHVGRVNTVARWEKFEDLGVDSCDGSGLVMPGGNASNERAKIAGRNAPRLEFQDA